MSMTFTKLFSSITASTIWAAPDHTRIVWITMLAMADQHGRVWASIPGLANIARVPIEATESALEELMSPDKYSRTKDNDGRRIEEIDGGWCLLNHAKYRAIRDEESIKQSKRAYINKRRAEERASKSVEQCRTESIAVDRGRANTEAEAEAEAEEKKEKATPADQASGSGARNVGRLVPVPSPPPFDGENAEILNGKAVVPLAAAWELPTQWGEDAEALGFKVADVIREAEKFRQYWVSGKGAGTRRNVKGWRQCWSNWLAKASERAQR